MKRYFSYATLLFITISCLSCKKDNNNTPAADIAGRIDFTTPLAGTIYDNGMILKIEGGMNDDNGLTTAKVEVRNKTTGAKLFEQSSVTGNVTLYHFIWNWTVTGMTASITATVKVTAIDKLSNQVIKEVDITLTN